MRNANMTEQSIPLTQDPGVPDPHPEDNMRKWGNRLTAFAAIDFLSFYILDLDITGVWWSPLVAGTIGGILIARSNGNHKEAATIGAKGVGHFQQAPEDADDSNMID